MEEKMTGRPAVVPAGPVRPGSDMDRAARPLSRDAVKGIAAAAMLLDHIALIFMDRWSVPGMLMVGIGHFTAITMCRALTEGFRRTRDRRRYGARFFAFALISQLPYSLAFTTAGRSVLSVGASMGATLFLCFVLLVLMERRDAAAGQQAGYAACTAAVILLSCFCDWGPLAPLFVMLFARAGQDPRAVKKAWRTSIAAAFIVDAVSMLSLTMPEDAGAAAVGAGPAPAPGLMYVLAAALLDAGGMALAMACDLYLYNGRRARRGRAALQLFFYLFYPIHLLVLGILRLLLR